MNNKFSDYLLISDMDATLLTNKHKISDKSGKLFYIAGGTVYCCYRQNEYGCA